MLLPGPPYEMKAMFEADAFRAARPGFPSSTSPRARSNGDDPESQVDARVAPIYKTYTDVETTILAGAGEISTSSALPEGFTARAEARVESSPKKSKTSSRLHFSRAKANHRTDRQLSAADAEHDAGRGGILSAPVGRAHHLDRRQLALFSGGAVVYRMN